MDLPPDLPTRRMEVTYKKSKFFRVVHADGCYGGLTPRGSVHFAFYNERIPIPRRSEFDVVSGVPGPERVLETKEGVFRELEVDVTMDFMTGVGFYIWLKERLEIGRVQLGMSDEDWEAMVRPK